MDLEAYQMFKDYLLYHKFPIDYTPQQQQNLSRQATYYIVENGILFYKNRKYPDNSLCVITLPDREKILYNLHLSPLRGHFEIKRTIELANEKYYWPTMAKDIQNYIET